MHLNILSLFSIAALAMLASSVYAVDVPGAADVTANMAAGIPGCVAIDQSDAVVPCVADAVIPSTESTLPLKRSLRLSRRKLIRRHGSNKHTEQEVADKSFIAEDDTDVYSSTFDDSDLYASTADATFANAPDFNEEGETNTSELSAEEAGVYSAADDETAVAEDTEADLSSAINDTTGEPASFDDDQDQTVDQNLDVDQDLNLDQDQDVDQDLDIDEGEEEDEEEPDEEEEEEDEEDEDEEDEDEDEDEDEYDNDEYDDGYRDGYAAASVEGSQEPDETGDEYASAADEITVL
ncbi:Protein transport protein yif1 [Mucor velutinosus]|uniref:Protein transport protein yif1 n=1 Tax=Mucor velutinosus TaxID=708070 RepID=A0AAN7D4R9_9FUNG|nr:Protein transport protein yif1 [Mucor velutinosus]